MRLIGAIFISLPWMLISAKADPPQYGLAGCQWQSDMAHIPEPWSSHSRTFAQGAIRLTHTTIGNDPECLCGEYLIILAPQRKDEDEGYRQCLMLVVMPQEQGFTKIDFGRLSSSYNADFGLTLTLPVQSNRDAQMRLAKIRFHDATGIVSLLDK